VGAATAPADDETCLGQIVQTPLGRCPAYVVLLLQLSLGGQPGARRQITRLDPRLKLGADQLVQGRASQL